MLSRDLPKTPGIYKIFFLDPNLLYIGSSVNLRQRLHGHRGALRRGEHGNSHLQHAYDKYGDNAFHFEIVEQVSCKEDLVEREQYYLDTLKPYYNIHPNARSSLGVKRTPEQRIKNGAAHRGKPSWNKGKTFSPEHRANLSTSHMGQAAWNKGKSWPPEHQERLRTMNKGKPNPHPGHHVPRRPPGIETRERMSQAQYALTPEQRAQKLEKFRTTQAAKTPEQRASEIEKWRISKYGKSDAP